MHHVLLIEDNPGDAALTRIAFEESGLDVQLQVSRNFQDARSLLDGFQSRSGEQHPELILLDLNLGDGSGHELLAYLKQQSSLRSIPVVIVTTSDSPQDRAQSMTLGAAAYVVKPNDFDCFVETLKGLMSFVPE